MSKAQKHKLGMLRVVGKQLNKALKFSAIIITNLQGRNQRQEEQMNDLQQETLRLTQEAADNRSEMDDLQAKIEDQQGGWQHKYKQES